MLNENKATLLVSNIRLPLGGGSAQAIKKAAKLAGIREKELLSAGVHRLSVDARRGTPVLVYTIALTVPQHIAGTCGNVPGVQLLVRHPLTLERGLRPLAQPPVVCGLGPAGLFAAWLLAKEGYRPIVLERGPEVERRMQAVQHYFSTGELDENANIQFGEGGAGTFSDGKLTTRINDPLCDTVTRILLEHGAPAEIAIRQKPHIGTDLLRDVIVSIRRQIQSLGGQVLFETQLTGLQQKDGRLTAVETTAGVIPTQALILAPGHSARDTFAMLQRFGLQLQCKPFSVGFRAEHLQADIEKALYHEAAGHPDLPRGEYQLSTHIGGRGVYTFCMCPGGQVVAAASEKDTVVTNGMSFHARDGANANAAVVVSVDDKDFGGDPARAVAFQRQLEHRAWQMGGCCGRAPAQNAAAFVKGTVQLEIGAVQPSYPLGVQAADLGELFGEELTGALRQGMKDFDRRIRGYAGEQAILTGVETRTSSPVRLPRDPETLQSVQLEGLYPTGEGAGYAGGIMSAAVDGIRAARALIAQAAPALPE